MDHQRALNDNPSPQSTESQCSTAYEEDSLRVEPSSPVKSNYSDTAGSVPSPDMSMSSAGSSQHVNPPTRSGLAASSFETRQPTLRDVSETLQQDFNRNDIRQMQTMGNCTANSASLNCSTRTSKRGRSKSIYPMGPGLVALDAFETEETGSRYNIHPALMILATQDAFGPKLTPSETSNHSPSIQTPIFPDSEPEQTCLHNNTHKPHLGDANNVILDYESLFFRDGRRRIDMVLVFQDDTDGVMTEIEARRKEQRRIFEQNLLAEGIQMELESKENSFDGKTNFLKLHIPWKTKIQYAECMNLKLPTKRLITISVKAWDEENLKPKSKLVETWRLFLQRFRDIHSWDTDKYPMEPSFRESTDLGDKEEKFVVKDRDSAYTPAQRSLIVMQILLRTKYDSTEKAGIRRLLADGTYIDSYCLHEGPYDSPLSNGEILDRYLLYLIWARPSQWYKKQPLWLVRRYFGDKVALYFAWLGFYTECLIAPAIVGLLCFVYGLTTMDGPDNTPSHEICDPKLAGNISLCPFCDKACDYQKLGDSCIFSKLTYLFDNPATVFFAIFMSFWATTFLELWKRRHAVLAWEWDLQNTEGDEEPRPEFETSVKTFRINPVTREREPYLPAYSQAWRYMVTGSVVFFMICIVLGAVLGTIIYRISLISVFYGGGFFLKRHAKIFTSMTAALINLIIIMILTRIYHRIARWMTNLENPRTQTEYENSFTFKIFVFEFVNFYSSLIYIAFFKGRFYVHPGDRNARASEFYRIKNDVCDPAGCLSEVCIQLAIIMIGKQCFNNFMELFLPKLRNWWRKKTQQKATKDQSRPYTTWESDYQLQDPGRLALFDEYLEMIVQYGFVTLFVAAFPLAPLFALLNNIGEIRLDAYKMVKEARRPLAERVEDIGAWYGILKAVTYAAVVSNAFVIAYTSDFIPRNVYAYVYSPTNDLVGYIDSSLSDFNTSDYREDMRSEATSKAPDICQYRGYRNPPNHSDPYGLSPQYWHVFAARLAFVVIFEHIVFALTGIMSYAIPEIPKSVTTQRQRERLLATEAKYEKGLRSHEEDEEVLSILRETGMINRPAAGTRPSWARRFSKISDSLDAHIEINNTNNLLSENNSIS